VVDAYGEDTVAEKAICVDRAALPAPRLTWSVPDPLTPRSPLMESARSPNTGALRWATGMAIWRCSSSRNRETVVSTCIR